MPDKKPENNSNKKVFIIALNRDPVDPKGKTRAELSAIFKEQTNNVLPLFKQELKDSGLEKDVTIQQLAPNLGMVIVETTPEAAEKIEKLKTVRMVMENQKIYLPRRGPKR
mgnify:CR=1 FL=1|jgi:hypothetical protein|tara:strand:- start:261 stop:593 length:333 start_codon:yes stop_codon:yes gene_type:complete